MDELESHGVVVGVSPDDDASRRVGSYATVVGGLPVVVVSAAEAGDVRALRYAGAHQLGHLVLHGQRLSPGVEQREAERFAAAFLMPQGPWSGVVPARLDWKILNAESMYWGVPVRVVARSLHARGALSTPTYYRLMQKVEALQRDQVVVPGYRESPRPWPGIG